MLTLIIETKLIIIPILKLMLKLYIPNYKKVKK